MRQEASPSGSQMANCKSQIWNFEEGSRVRKAIRKKGEEKLPARKRPVKFVVRSDPEPDYLLSFA